MNVEIWTETPLFLFWEYLFQNFGILYFCSAVPSSYKREDNVNLMKYSEHAQVKFIPQINIICSWLKRDAKSGLKWGGGGSAAYA